MDMFRGSSTQLYVPAFTQKDFTIAFTQDFPHREPPLRILGKYNTGIHNSSLNPIQPLTRGKAQDNTISTSHKRGRHLAKYKSTSQKRD